MKDCLQCQKPYEAKKETSKFCSTNCRVKWNRKNGNKKEISTLEMKVLYNAMLELLDKAKNNVTASEKINTSNPTTENKPTIERMKITRSFENYRQLRIDCPDDEEWLKLKQEIFDADNLTEKQKVLLTI